MRREQPIYEVTFTTYRSGTIMHMVPASREDDALDRIRRAYPGQSILVTSVIQLIRVYDTKDVHPKPQRGGPLERQRKKASFGVDFHSWKNAESNVSL